MLQLVNRVFGQRNVRRPAARSRSYRPSFEGLEERRVLSTSSTAIHAVTDNFGHSEVFYIGKQNHAFYEHDANGNHWLSGPYTVQSFSAGLDSSGHADAFVTAGDNSIWEWNSSGWHKLYEPERMVQFAAVKGDRAYAKGVDGALYEYSPPYTIYLPPFHIPIHLGGWQRLDGPGAVQSIDAVTDTAGRDAVFAVRGDSTFQERFNGQWQFLTGATPSSFSAGTDLNGNADVFGLFGGQLWRHTTSGWTALGALNTVRTISATNAGQVAFIDTAGHLMKFDGSGILHDLDSNSSFLEVSAAASNDVYTTVWDFSGWERTGGGVWNNWSPAGTVL
jgi:hypothetical protein